MVWPPGGFWWLLTGIDERVQVNEFERSQEGREIIEI
jgi:hypothetical protein